MTSPAAYTPPDRALVPTTYLQILELLMMAQPYRRRNQPYLMRKVAGSNPGSEGDFLLVPFTPYGLIVREDGLTRLAVPFRTIDWNRGYSTRSSVI